MAVIMTVTSGILISLARASQKSKAVIDIKNNGNNVISLIEEAVRTGKSLSVINNTLSYVDQSDKAYELGFVPAGICSNQNGYIYLVDIALNNKCDAKVRMTNDNIKDGVNVESFSLTIDNIGNSPRVSVIMTVNKSVANNFLDDDVRTDFRTYVTSRSSIAN